MTHEQLAAELKLQGPFLSIRRTHGEEPSELDKGCALSALNRALSGEALVITADAAGCRGAAGGFGFRDGLPDMPGGFGHFLSKGRGQGFPPGERIKCSPAVGEAMFLGQPQCVMGGFDAIAVKPYEDADEPDTVTVLVGMDQLAALIHLFCFRRAAFDDVIAPMVSGCASVFRVPFGELRRALPRAVIGNVDVFSRPHFGAGAAFFTVSGRDFAQMLADANESVLAAPIWNGVKARL